jgi:Ni/Co efflux regulator RcnB
LKTIETFNYCDRAKISCFASGSTTITPIDSWGIRKVSNFGRKLWNSSCGQHTGYLFTTLNEVLVKRSHIAAAVLFSSLGLASAAFAQGNPGGHDDHGGPQQRPGGQPQQGMQGHGNGYQNQNQAQNRGPQGNPGGQHHDNNRPPPRADNGPGRGGPGMHGDSPREWRRGDRLPNDYRDRQYVVDDYRGYGLQQPPRGYHWVGVGGDYVLAAVATGVIAQIVLSGGH